MGSRTIMLAAALIALVGLRPAAAQTNPTLSEAERGIRRDDADTPAHLRITEAKVTAHVVGRTAEVTVDLLIGSDASTPYEANLALALPNDAVVTGYALDVGGTMIAGQLLEQPKARNVYEDEVRQGIDPGLGEVSAENRFITRIFPIDATHPRRFRLSFVAPFDPVRGIELPLARDAPIGRVEVAITVDGYAASPEVRLAGKALALTSGGVQWRGAFTAANTVLRGSLAITGGTLATPMSVMRHASGDRFFTIADSGAVPPTSSPRGGRLRIYWDRSVSHRDDRTDLEIETLVRLADLTAPAAIDLVTFASDAPQVTALADASALRGALGKVIYRGGTSLAGLAGLDGLGLPAAARCVMVSDGQVTIDRAAHFAPDCPVTILTASNGADGPRLTRLAEHTGGRLVRIAGDDVADAAARLSGPGSPIAAVRDEGGRAIEVRAFPAAPGGWLLVGRLPQSGQVRVRLADGSTRTYSAPDITADAGASADGLAALWAVQRVSELADDPARHKEMADLSRRYRVAGPGMAFLVLERPDQYLRAEIAPPPGFAKEWLTEYRTAKVEADGRASTARRERLDTVVTRWAERRAWWNTRFAAKSRTTIARQREDGGSAGIAESLPPPPPPLDVPMPAPPPPPVVAPAPSSEQSGGPAIQNTPVAVTVVSQDDVSDVIVTASRREDLPAVVDSPGAPGKAITLDLADLLGKRPYLAALDSARPADRLKVLVDQELAYATVPTFYLDTAEWFRLKGDRPTAALLLLSALELPASDDETRQIVAFRLERDGSFDRAVELAEHLAAANAEFRPQPARDLALALAARGGGGEAGAASARSDLERAFTLLTDTALNPASGDFDGIEVIALMEANALIPAIEAAGGKWALDRRLTGRLDTDARIVIEWTADDADIDLWVNEPNGERVYYATNLSSAGGQISNDMTNGYGPEEYAIRSAPAGDYAVRINGYDADRINPNGPGHVLIRLIRNFARPSQRQELVDADLSFQAGVNRNNQEESKPVATLRIGK